MRAHAQQRSAVVTLRVRRWWWTLCAMAIALASLATPPNVSATRTIEGPEAIALFNQQRVANGIPPVTDNQQFAAAWCPAEDSGPSGGESGRDLSSVVSGWSATSSPWDNAPLHQQDIYNPIFTQAGDVNVGAQTCLGVGAPLPEPGTPTFAAFFSDRGADEVLTTETVEHEGPFAPQQLAGIPQGRPTGGQLILYAEGMGEEVHATSWTLTKADGAQVPDVKLVDDTEANAAGYPGYLMGVGVLIPPALKARSMYNLTVVWEGTDGITATQTLSFKTTAATNQLRIYGKDSYLYGESQARGGTLTASRSGHTLRVAISSRTRSRHFRGRLAFARLSSGRWHVCVMSGGGTTGYVPERQCVYVSIQRG